MTAAESAERAHHYDPREIQEKWQARWAEMDLFRASDDPGDSRPRTYLLDMFPYPSGDLHMGHAEAYAIADAVARYYFQRHHNVLHPIGWDAFGLPADDLPAWEDAAIHHFQPEGNSRGRNFYLGNNDALVGLAGYLQAAGYFSSFAHSRRFRIDVGPERAAPNLAELDGN